MSKIFLFIFVSNSLISFSQKECNLNYNDLIILSSETKDTIYLKVSLKNKVSDKFLKSNMMSLTYRYSKNKNYSEKYVLDIEDISQIKNKEVIFIYNIIKYCLLNYQISFFHDNFEKIISHSKDKIPFYNYRLNIIIIPQLPED